jgi:hypothetical protein
LGYYFQVKTIKYAAYLSAARKNVAKTIKCLLRIIDFREFYIGKDKVEDTRVFEATLDIMKKGIRLRYKRRLS